MPTITRVRPLRVGDRVKKIMGVAQTGTVVRAMLPEKYTDGSYRPPYGYENVVYVKWDDRTVGWIHNIHVVREK